MCVCVCVSGVPGQVLSQVNQVIETAKRGETTLYKACALLDFTSEAFQYARQASQDTFDLSRVCQKKLEQSDHVFTEMMEARLNTLIEQAEDCQDKCVHCLGESGARGNTRGWGFVQEEQLLE